MARFFNILLQGFDWEGLDNRTLDPPITPKVLIRENKKTKKNWCTCRCKAPRTHLTLTSILATRSCPGTKYLAGTKSFEHFSRMWPNFSSARRVWKLFFVRTSAFKYLDSGDISWQPIVIQGCISRTAGRLLCKKPHLCSRTLLCIWKGAQDIFLYHAFDVQYVQKRKIGSWTKNTKSQSFEKWKNCVDNHRPLWFFVIFVDIL